MNDVDRRCRSDRHSRAADPDVDGGTNCGRAADLYRSTASAHTASYHASYRVTISSVSVADSGRPRCRRS